MTLALGLLVTSVLIGVAGPRYLRLTVTPSVRPGLALAAWTSSVTLMLTAAPAAAVMLALPRSSGVDGLIGMANSCVNIVRADGEVVWEHVARLAVAAALLALTCWVAVVAVRLVRRHRRWRSAHLSLLRAACRTDRSVLWVDQDAPVAYSVGGRAGAVVVTSGVAHLRRAEREAILAHERAHLRGRHHMLVLTAEIVAVALPFLPLARSAPGAVRVLVELAADATAARHCGSEPVRSALLAVSAHGAPPPSLAMSREAVEARLCWLVHDRTRLRWLPAGADYMLAAVLSLAPALASVALVAGVILLYCLGATSA